LIASTRVTGQGESPKKWMIMLHGILGMGANWRSFAQKLVKRAPEWGAILVDLRNHGGSRGFAPPHTVEATAKDLLGFEFDAVLGHSFGGKVALELAKLRALDAVFVVDSTPAPRKELIGTDWGALGVVQTLRTLPKSLPKRTDFVRALIDKGIDEPTAQWLAMNARQEASAFVLDLDLDAIQEMLADYFTIDLWDAAAQPNVHFIAGSRGSMPDGDRERTHATILDAGHWVHVDAPEALLDVVLRVIDR
jgi:pimeloyl-ACP methyl ester carboxylesterase